MGFLDKLFGAKADTLAAPCAGHTVPLRAVPDPAFSEEILGKGVAIEPAEGRICAPCDGTVEMMFATGHAVSLKAACGADVLIHVGLDTVQLKGRHFTVHAKNGDAVKAGQLLIEVDLAAVAAAGYNTITPLIVCNSDEYTAVEAAADKTVAQGETVLTLKK
jgi:glucose-specific phosphotransferase system IIA component